MDSNIESVPFDVESEEIEINVDPMIIIKSEFNIESEEYDDIDVTHENHQIDISPICTTSKVEDTEVCMVKLLNDSEKKLQAEEISGNTVLPVVQELTDTTGIYLKGDKFALREHAGEKAEMQSIYASSFFEHYNSSISQRRNLVKHMGEKSFQCDFCSKSFSEKKNLVLHMYIHTGEKNFTCSVCNKSFSRKFHLDRHMRTHSGEKPFQCEFCSKSFSEKMNLIVHMFKTCSRTTNSNNCDSSVSDQHNGNEHMLRRPSVKPFKCDFCSKSFSEKKNLVSHMAIHTGKKNFSCYICSKAFFRKFHLDRHMRTHSGEKRYQCELCNKLFSEKNNLLVHMHSHTVEKYCNICNKSFLRNLDLYQHLINHTPE